MTTPQCCPLCDSVRKDILLGLCLTAAQHDWHTAPVPAAEPLLKCGHTESQHQRDWEAVQPTSPERSITVSHGAAPGVAAPSWAKPASPEPLRCPSCNSNHPLADGSWAVPCNDPWHKPAVACCICGEPDADHSMAAGKLHHQITTTEGCQSCAALRSQLEEALDRGNAYLAEMTQWRGKHGQAERDLATAQARIALATTFLRRADATSTQNELYDLLDEARQALAEPQSGDK